jgi:uncharacterized protein (TIGR02444 family)
MKSNEGLTQENPFWDFSIKFYGQNPVSSSCLALQENVGADINILLYCCWIASEGAAAMEGAEFSEIISVIEPWQSKVVNGLRQIRRSIKKDPSLRFGSFSDGLRVSIKNSELEAEKLEQMILYSSGQKIFSSKSIQPFDKVANAEVNLRTYIEMISGSITETTNSLILIICEQVKSNISQ